MIAALDRACRPYLMTLRNSFLRDIEYRANYVILIFAVFVTVLMEKAIFDQVFIQRESAGTLSRDQALAFVILGTLVRNASALWTLVGEAVDQIRDGSFRTFLLQPIHYPSYFLSQFVGPKFITWFLSLVTLAVGSRYLPALAPLFTWNVGAPFALSILLSFTIVVQIYLVLVYLGFWLDDTSFLTISFNIAVGIFSGSQIPASWLPVGLQRALEATPLLILGDFPIRAGLGLLTSGEFQGYALQAVVWIVALGALNACLWRAGTKRYEAHGG